MNPQNYSLSKQQNGLYQSYSAASLQIPPGKVGSYQAAHQSIPYGAVSFEEAMEKPELNMSLYWRGYPAPNVRFPPQPRIDYRGVPQLFERAYQTFDRRLTYPNTAYHPLFQQAPLDYSALAMQTHPSFGERQLMEFEMSRHRSFTHRHGHSLIPTAPEPKRRDKVPEVIVLEDSDDSQIQVREVPPPPAQITAPVAIQPKISVEQPKPTAIITSPTVIKKTRQNKPLVKKASAPVKPIHPVVRAYKRRHRPLVTKPPIVDEEPTVNWNLKIKIKKHNKQTKSDSGKQKDRERPTKEVKDTTGDKLLPNYGDSHGKIQSGINYQAEISEFIANDKNFSGQKQQKLGQLQGRMRWDSKTNYVSYNMIRQEFPNIEAGKIINFLISCTTSPATIQGFRAYFQMSNEERKVQQSPQECQKDDQLLTSENARITRQNIKNKSLLL